ncbi:MAG: FAD:protein FMN transferase [Thermodesulfobacteriota bacterium]
MRVKQIYVYITLILFLVSCSEGPTNLEPIERMQSHMGTYARVLIYGGNQEDVNTAFNKIKELDNLLSDYNPSSQISLINKNAGITPVNIDPQVKKVLKLSKSIASQTDGAFDPTIGALTIAVYRFGRDDGTEPNIEQIDKAKALVNYKDLILKGDTAYLKRKGMMIDLGGIGKGFAVQSAVDVLKDRGVESGVVSLSGDFKVFGHTAEIAIQNPNNIGAIATFKTANKDLAISTSGSYERYINVDGNVYHHLIIPETGKPGHDFLSLTVVMDQSAALADAYATALFVMGSQKALMFVEEHKDIGVFIVYADKKTYYNKAFTNLVADLVVTENVQ